MKMVTIWQRICLAVDRTRRLTIWGIMNSCGRHRDMLYLHNGGWIDFSPAIDSDQIELWYDYERHRLREPAEAVEGRCDRCGWLSAVERSGRQRDLTPWLEGLRVPRGRGSTLPVRILLGLFAQQNGWVPRGVLTVTLRDGSEEQVDADRGVALLTSSAPCGPDR